MYMPDGGHLVSYFTRRPMPLPLLQSGSGLSYSVSIPLPFSSPSLPNLIADVSNVVHGRRVLYQFNLDNYKP